MKKLKNYIDAIATDKLRHRVLGQYLNPAVFILVAIFCYALSSFLEVAFIQWFIVPIALLGCWQVHYQIEIWQLKTNSGKFEVADAKAGFSSAKLIALLVVVIQILNHFL